MANLKSLKLRIKSVRSTQKITKAMKMVSASKLRRARENAEAAQPYATRIEAMVARLATGVEKESAPALLVGNKKAEHHLLVVVTSDRGLCGGLNTTVYRQVRRTIESLLAAGKEVSIYCIGKKGADLLRYTYQSRIVHQVEGISKQKKISYDDANNQALRIIKLFEEGKFDVCTLFYNKFVSAIEQIPTAQQIIPLVVPETEATDAQISYEYEPSEEAILDSLLPRNLAVQIFHALLENSASEHGARMTAMDNASRNAGDMIKKLNLLYNRTRQAAITSELIEIISGAEAV